LTLRGRNKDIRNEELHNLCSSSNIVIMIIIIEYCENGGADRNKVTRNLLNDSLENLKPRARPRIICENIIII